MMCLACDANYADVVSTAADGTIQIKIQSKSCDNLMKNCFEYVSARAEAGAQTKVAVRAKKVRSKKGDLEGLTKKLEECMDDTACSTSDKATKMKALQTKLTEVATEKSTDAEKKKV